MITAFLILYLCGATATFMAASEEFREMVDAEEHSRLYISLFWPYYFIKAILENE